MVVITPPGSGRQIKGKVLADGTIRLVVPWSVTDRDVDGFLEATRGYIGEAA